MMVDKNVKDISVLIIFYSRYDTLIKVFDAVKKARPRRLFLWQDGPRVGDENELNKLKKCRDIFENINWDCEVHKNYLEKNLGCDPSTYYAQRWAFSLTDKCIVLEDDQVPSTSFFDYCKELLDKYENDERVSHINGHNYLGNCNWCPYDYLFAKAGSGAWASWARVINNLDDTYDFLNNEYLINNFKKTNKKIAKQWLDVATKHKNSGIQYWESILGMNAVLNDRLAIIPAKNLVKNIGLTTEATHSLDSVDLLPKAQRGVFVNEAEEISFPIKHPSNVFIDYKYEKEFFKINNPSFFRRFFRKISLFFLLLKKGKIKLIFSKFKNKLCCHK